MKCPKCRIENPSDSKYCKECATPLPSSEELFITATKTLRIPMKELEIGATFARKYQIQEEIGKGGMGVVYKALDKEIEEDVAIKILKPEIVKDKSIIERFRNELKIARKISHKNVCRMYDLNKEEDTYYIAMEYVPGEDLKDTIRREEKLSTEKAIDIAKQVCEGLAEAHELGVIHRDLKPQNIMIDEKGRARIMDFGIARSEEAPGVTQTGIIIGTPDYISPEQAEGEEADQRSDIYSLGVILYEMVTGQTPFKGDSALSVALKHKAQMPRDPRKLNPEVSDDLGRLILICMEKDRKRRYQTAEALLSDLRNVEQGLPLGTKSKPRRETFAASLLRKKLFIPALVAALVVIAVLIWQLLPQKAPIPIPSDRPSLAVVYFENPSGDQSLEGWRIMLADLMTTDLMQSKFIDVLTGDRVFSIHKKLDLLDTKKYATEDLIRVADEGRVNHMISGSFIRAEDEILITVHLQKPHTGEVINSRKVTCRGEADIAPRVDELTGLIKADLNLSQEQIASDFDKEVGKITTSSPEAYRLYAEGRTLHMNGEYQKGISLMERAVEIDPEFAMAYRSLWAAHNNMGNYREAMTYLEKAHELTDRLSERERLIIQARYLNEKFPGKYTKEYLETLEKLVDLYPEDFYGNLGLAILYTNLEEVDKAIKLLEFFKQKQGVDGSLIYIWLTINYRNKGMYDKAEEIIKEYLDKFPENILARRHLFFIYERTRNYDMALAELDKIYSINPNNFVILLDRGDIYHLRGDFKKAEDEYMRVVEEDQTGVAGMGVQKLVYLYLLQGRFRECEAIFERGFKMIEQAGSGKRWKLNAHNGLAFFYMETGCFEKALEEYEKVWKISVELEDIGVQRMLYLNRGLAYLKMNKIDKALEDAAQLKNLIEEGVNKKLMRHYYHLMGKIELEEKSFPQAIDYLQLAISLQTTGSDARYIDAMASAYYRSGDLDRALEEYEKITNLTYERLVRGVLYVKSFYMLGKICEEKGWEGKAIENYERFLDLWKDADPGIAEVEDAKERLAVLRSQ